MFTLYLCADSSSFTASLFHMYFYILSTLRFMIISKWDAMCIIISWKLFHAKDSFCCDFSFFKVQDKNHTRVEWIKYENSWTSVCCWVAVTNVAAVILWEFSGRWTWWLAWKFMEVQEKLMWIFDSPTRRHRVRGPTSQRCGGVPFPIFHDFWYPISQSWGVNRYFSFWPPKPSFHDAKFWIPKNSDKIHSQGQTYI